MVGDLRTGLLWVTPEAPAAGAPAEVAYAGSGRNGCYRQGPVSVAVRSPRIVLSYATQYVDGACTLAMVPAGFRQQVRFPAPGTWKVRVEIDGELAQEATVKVGAAP